MVKLSTEHGKAMVENKVEEEMVGKKEWREGSICHWGWVQQMVKWWSDNARLGSHFDPGQLRPCLPQICASQRHVGSFAFFPEESEVIRADVQP